MRKLFVVLSLVSFTIPSWSLDISEIRVKIKSKTYLYSKPSVRRGEKLQLLQSGELWHYLKRSQKKIWFQITDGDTEGWVHRKKVQLAKITEPEPMEEYTEENNTTPRDRINYDQTLSDDELIYLDEVKERHRQKEEFISPSDWLSILQTSHKTYNKIKSVF